MRDFDRIIELKPSDAWALNSRGEIYRSLRRYEEALRDFDRAIEFDPANDWYLYERSLIEPSRHRDPKLGDRDRQHARGDR